MESAYVDELKASINLLMANLESLPVTKGSSAESKYSLQKFKKYSKYVRRRPSHVVSLVRRPFIPLHTRGTVNFLHK